VTELDGTDVSDKQVQPVGVELTVDTIYKVSGYTILKDDEYRKGKRREKEVNSPGQYILDSNERGSINEVGGQVSPEEYDDDKLVKMDRPYYTLQPGSYVVQYNEKISVPEDTVGFVLPRSRFIRSNNFLSTAVWDAGYSGRGEGGLDINTLTFLEDDMRIGVFVLADANTYQKYVGTHQQENLSEEQ